eukprot:TRINITY_DN3073_c0_g4_i1.p3 TRINITY_DN3073_c0_g4~~TRINITY_DN3073_c0_g4_i1.p3  ORF type:complete len:187 (-),score=2.40 TRINITY_DN3073_c0_g4_i1:89-649(-)
MNQISINTPLVISFKFLQSQEVVLLYVLKYQKMQTYQQLRIKKKKKKKKKKNEQWPDFGCEGIKVQRAHQPTSQCQEKALDILILFLAVLVWLYPLFFFLLIKDEISQQIVTRCYCLDNYGMNQISINTPLVISFKFLQSQEVVLLYVLKYQKMQTYQQLRINSFLVVGNQTLCDYFINYNITLQD